MTYCKVMSIECSSEIWELVTHASKRPKSNHDAIKKEMLSRNMREAIVKHYPELEGKDIYQIFPMNNKLWSIEYKD